MIPATLEPLPESSPAARLSGALVAAADALLRDGDLLLPTTERLLFESLVKVALHLNTLHGHSADAAAQCIVAAARR